MRKNTAEKSANSNRRAFLKAGGIMTAAVLGSATLPDVASGRPGPASNGLPSNAATSDSMPTRNLGKTGYKVGIFSLGGQAALEKANNEANAIPVIEKALDLGVNYIDTSSIYGGPERWSEQYVGKVMKHRRSDAFLATKTKERTRDGSMRMIETSLKLLQTDHIDLWQLHDIGTMTDINEIFAKGGAMEALLQAREQKIVRYLGITGHYRPDALIEAIHRHPFDTILMAVNAADPHHYSFSEQLLPLAVEKQMGIIGMKVPARGRILSSWTPPPIEQQKHMWRRRRERSICGRRCIIRFRCRSVPSSSGAIPLPSWSRTYNWHANSRRSTNSRWRRSPRKLSRWQSSHCSSASMTGPRDQVGDFWVSRISGSSIPGNPALLMRQVA